MLTWLYSLNLLSGWLPIAGLIAAILAFLFLLVRRSRRWWFFSLFAAISSVGVAWFICWAVIDLWFWWPEVLPITVNIWVAVATWGVILGLTTALTGWRARKALSGVRHAQGQRTTGPKRVNTWPRRGVSIIAVLVILTVSGLQINQYFGSFPTLNALIYGGPKLKAGVPVLPIADKKDRFLKTAVKNGWVAPKDLPSVGEFRRVKIPGTISKFAARDGIVYLPPAYFAKDRPTLPVVVLVTGQPGAPSNWLQSANLEGILNGYAQKHNGLAPVVVMPDPNGSESGNTMCMNSQLGQADDYMSKDVPNWIVSTLDVDTNHQHWAVGGFSYGGTCAFQMVTRHPDVYPNFFSISAELEPALTSDRTITVQRAFGGDAAAFNAVLPMTLMARNEYPQVHGWLATGESDSVYTQYAVQLEEAGTKSGMKLTRTTFLGGHSWVMVTDALPAAFSYLGTNVGLE